MSAPSTVAAALASLLDTAPSWLPQVDHWEIAEDTDTWILSGQLAGDPREAEAFRLLAPVIERAPSTHSDDGRLVKVPFEWDGVAGQVWYLRPVERYIVPERCASCPTLLADAGNQFVRLGGRGAPVICVPCRDRMHEAWVREAAVRELGALPMPVGSEPVSEAALDVAVDGLAQYLRVRLALESAKRGRREARARVAELEAARREFPLFYLADYEGASLTLHLTREAARDVCDDFAQAEARGRCWDWRAENGVEFQFWTDPDNDRPIGETGGAIWEVQVEDSSGPKTYPPALPWARLMDDEDLSDFLDDLADAAGTPGSYEGALATVENAISRHRLIAEAQHAHNTAPGPDAEAGEPS